MPFGFRAMFFRFQKFESGIFLLPFRALWDIIAIKVKERNVAVLKLWVRFLAFLFGALCILSVVLLARGSFLSLSERFNGRLDTPTLALPLPILLLLGAAILASFALAALLTLRALARIKRKENEESENEGDQMTVKTDEPNMGRKS